MSALASLTQNYSDSDNSAGSDDEQQHKHSRPPVILTAHHHRLQTNGSSNNSPALSRMTVHSRPGSSVDEHSDDGHRSGSSCQPPVYVHDEEIFIPGQYELTDDEDKEEQQSLKTNRQEVKRSEEEQDDDLVNENHQNGHKTVHERRKRDRTKSDHRRYRERTRSSDEEHSVSDEEQKNSADDHNSRENSQDDSNPPMSPVSFHRNLINMPEDELKIPTEPLGQRCSERLLEKFRLSHNLMKQGRDMKATIQNKKSFRNPSIYAKLITFCEIDELGTNFPPEIYEPHCWKDEDFFENLTKRQNEEYSLQKEKEEQKKSSTKVEIISGTAKKLTAGLASGGSASGGGCNTNSSRHSLSSNDISTQAGSHSKTENDKPSSKKRSKWDVPAASMTSKTSGSGSVGTLINPEIIKQKLERSSNTSNSHFHK